MRRRFRLLALVATLACSLAWAPARAETTAERLQRLLWTYGDTGTGWTGADGTYSVPLPDGRVVWLFSDTFLGTVNPDHSRPNNTPFVNNSMIVQDGDTLTTLVGPGPRSLIVPPDGAGFYWVGDGVVDVVADELLVFAMRFVSAPLPFAFQQVGTDVARFSLHPLAFKGITRTPLAFAPGIGAVPVSYGAAVMTQAGYHYVYGVEDLHADKYLHLARVREGHLLDESWEFWGPDGWSPLPALSVRLMAGVANELSITPVAGTYALVTQDHAIGRNIVVSTAPAPQGPWTLPVPVFDTQPTGNLITYNAKAHEEFSSERTLVVSYNVNSRFVAEVYANVDNYRPRFVEITV